VVNPKPLDQDWEIVVGWIAALILAGLILPLFAMMYLDNLTINKRTEKNLEKTERLERQIQELKREVEKEKRDE
jgi:ABC-type transport system involved in cytochrome bd biosynthesis fused ATPase/permease subunit